MNYLKTTCSIALFFITTSIVAQENKLKFHSSSLGIGVTSLSTDVVSGEVGISLNADLATNLNNHIISFYLNVSSEIKVWISEVEEDVTELNVTYGREIELKSWMTVEGHFGVGYFNYTIKNRSTDFSKKTKSTIGFPFRVKLLFYTGQHFVIGLNPNINLNSLANKYTGNLIFQYRF